MLKVNGLTVWADTKAGLVSIVKQLSFNICKGETLAIVGESGCGKTMTAMSLFGLLPNNCSSSGSVFLHGEELLGMSKKQLEKIRGKDIVLIPQSGSDFLNPVFKIRYQVYETLKRSGVKRAGYENEACRLLQCVGFDDPESVLDKYPFQLSGGMAQRVILAIGLAAEPMLVVADEPTRGVDDETSVLFMEQLTNIFSNAAIIIITHNISMACFGDKILVMYAGRLMEYGDCKNVLASPCHPYTKSLLSALPENDFDLFDEALSHCSFEGDDGCPFYPRCPDADLWCRKNLPSCKEHNGIVRRCFHAAG